MRGGIGTPAQLREYFRRYEAAGVDQLLLYSQVGRNDHDHICESLELFAREVMPEFVERDRSAHRRREPKRRTLRGEGAGAQTGAAPKGAGEPMKVSLMNVIQHRELPDDFAKRYHSNWVDLPFRAVATPEQYSRFYWSSIEEMLLRGRQGL